MGLVSSCHGIHLFIKCAPEYSLSRTVSLRARRNTLFGCFQLIYSVISPGNTLRPGSWRLPQTFQCYLLRCIVGNSLITLSCRMFADTEECIPSAFQFLSSTGTLLTFQGGATMCLVVTHLGMLLFIPGPCYKVQFPSNS